MKLVQKKKSYKSAASYTSHISTNIYNLCTRHYAAYKILKLFTNKYKNLANWFMHKRKRLYKKLYRYLIYFLEFNISKDTTQQSSNTFWKNFVEKFYVIFTSFPSDLICAIINWKKLKILICVLLLDNHNCSKQLNLRAKDLSFILLEKLLLKMSIIMMILHTTAS